MSDKPKSNFHRKLQEEMKERQEKREKDSRNTKAIGNLFAFAIVGCILVFYLSKNGCHYIGEDELIRMEDGHQYFKTHGATDSSLEHSAGCDHNSHKN